MAKGPVGFGFQAWRGVPSHYNFTTALDAALMRGGAGGAAGIFLIGVIVLLIAALRSSDTDASVRLGVIAGVVVLLVGCVIGFVMISNNSGVYQGSIGAGFARQTAGYLGPDAATVGPQYGLLRPATQGGDLVAPHIIGIHGLILLAVPVVLLARTAMTRRRQLRPHPAGHVHHRGDRCTAQPPRAAVGVLLALAIVEGQSPPAPGGYAPDHDTGERTGYGNSCCYEDAGASRPGNADRVARAGMWATGHSMSEPGMG